MTPFIRSLSLMCITFFVHGVTASLANMGKEIMKIILRNYETKLLSIDITPMKRNIGKRKLVLKKIIIVSFSQH